MDPIYAQIVGIIAVATFVISYQQKTRARIIILNVTSRILFIAQYLMLGAISGAVLDILGAIASVIAEKKDTGFIKRHTKAVCVTVSLVITACGTAVCIINRSLLDLLPIVGVLLHTGAFWLSDEKVIRRLSILGSPFWLAYNLASGAFGSAIGDVLTITSILIAMVKFKDFKKENQEKSR